MQQLLSGAALCQGLLLRRPLLLQPDHLLVERLESLGARHQLGRLCCCLGAELALSLLEGGDACLRPSERLLYLLETSLESVESRLGGQQLFARLVEQRVVLLLQLGLRRLGCGQRAQQVLDLSPQALLGRCLSGGLSLHPGAAFTLLLEVGAQRHELDGLGLDLLLKLPALRDQLLGSSPQPRPLRGRALPGPIEVLLKALQLQLVVLLEALQLALVVLSGPQRGRLEVLSERRQLGAAVLLAGYQPLRLLLLQTLDDLCLVAGQGVPLDDPLVALPLLVPLQLSASGRGGSGGLLVRRLRGGEGRLQLCHTAHRCGLSLLGDLRRLLEALRGLPRGRLGRLNPSVGFVQLRAELEQLLAQLICRALRLDVALLQPRLQAGFSLPGLLERVLQAPQVLHGLHPLPLGRVGPVGQCAELDLHQAQLILAVLGPSPHCLHPRNEVLGRRVGEDERHVGERPAVSADQGPGAKLGRRRQLLPERLHMLLERGRAPRERRRRRWSGHLPLQRRRDRVVAAVAQVLDDEVLGGQLDKIDLLELLDVVEVVDGQHGLAGLRVRQHSEVALDLGRRKVLYRQLQRLAEGAPLSI